jgi:hypothetical protein
MVQQESRSPWSWLQRRIARQETAPDTGTCVHYPKKAWKDSLRAQRVPPGAMTRKGYKKCAVIWRTRHK